MVSATPTAPKPSNHARKFASILIDQAEAALTAGLHLAAGCLVRASLEAHLRELHRDHPAADKPGPNSLGSLMLFATKLYGLERGRIKRALDKSNRAVHGIEVAPETVCEILEIARSFIVDTSGAGVERPE